MNRVELLGRLTKDPEMKYSQNGANTAVARYTLAVDRRGKKVDRDGQSADFISCVAFGKTAEVVMKYLKKGTMIVVCGRIMTGSYTNSEGKKVYTTSVVADEHFFVGKKQSGQVSDSKMKDLEVDENGFAMQMVAACTNRQELPNMLPMEPFNVLYQTAEDGYGDTIKPRLKACGADLSRVKFIVEEEKSLTMLDDRIEKAIIENDIHLLILDPLQAYIGSEININQSNETRSVFKKIGRIAEKTGCAIVVIGHLNKNSGSQSSYKGLGSIDIFAAARSVILVGRVKKEQDLRIVLQLKDSLAPAERPVAFTIQDGKVVWAGEYEITPEQLMAGGEGTKKETKLVMAERIIHKILKERKLMYVSDLEEILIRQGISARTARDARSKIENEVEYGWDGNKKTVKLKNSEEETGI